MAALAQQNNNFDEYFEAVKKGDLHEVKAFLRDGQVLPESTNKVCLQVLFTVKKLVLANMSNCVSQGGFQAIHIATVKGHTEIVEYLLDEHGVSPKAQLQVSKHTSVCVCSSSHELS